jgi:hypothetical protein
MSKTVLEQALDQLLNKEEDKAAALLHDYYVGVGRQVYEDIMADDIAFDDEDAQNATQAVEEVEADLTEEGDDEFAPEMGGEEEATDDLGADLGDEGAAPVDADSADVADAMMDVESALAKLKAEFEEMVGGGEVERAVGGRPPPLPAGVIRQRRRAQEAVAVVEVKKRVTIQGSFTQIEVNRWIHNNRNAMNADFVECFLDIVQFERLDDCLNFFHTAFSLCCDPSTTCLTAASMAANCSGESTFCPSKSLT